MFCTRCGRQLPENENFCPTCGNQLRAAAAAPLMPRQNRIAGHIRLLGILWLAVSAFRMLPGIIIMTMMKSGFPFGGDPDVPPFLPKLLEMMGAMFVLTGILGLIAGVGLLMRKSWARIFAIVIGILGLIDMPFGTALGIYTLWVLLPAESETQYRQISQAA
ncbi:MAG TPA: zinc ribbon domain-containing protein [Bryobacteraceae bacterium]|nr:zinc ribbon domain-containing protein [Bryobacteraceae bacterium]